MKWLQQQIIENRIKRGWPSATELHRTTLGIAEELGEFERARRNNNMEEMIDALADISVFVLGAFEILKRDAQVEITKVVYNNSVRTGQTEH